MRPYWSAFIDTDDFNSSFREIEEAKTEEEKRKSLEEMLEKYTKFLERILEDDCKWNKLIAKKQKLIKYYL